MIFFNPASQELTLISTPRGWVLGEQVDVFFTRGSFTIHKGFKTDLASIPAVLRPIVSNDDYKVRNPAIVHDYLYSKNGRVVQNTPSWQKVLYLSRKDCDRLFYEALRFYGMSKTKAWLMWLAVRVGGWKAWDHV